MITRIIGLLIFIFAMGLAYISYDQFQEDIEWHLATPSKRLNLIVENDFKNLLKKRELPEEWNYIENVNYKMNSPVTASLMGKERPQLIQKRAPAKTEKKSDQSYEAEVEVIDIPDEQNPGFILQISLLDIKTKNKVFEIGRSYYFSDLNKKKPD